MAYEYVVLRSIAQWRNAPSNDLEILKSSKKNNDAFGLTGRLHKENGWYFHILEGEASALRDIVSRILRDPRHFAAEVVASEECSARRFQDWDMGFGDGCHDKLENLVGTISADRLSIEDIAKVEMFLVAQARSSVLASTPCGIDEFVSVRPSNLVPEKSAA